MIVYTFNFSFTAVKSLIIIIIIIFFFFRRASPFVLKKTFFLENNFFPDGNDFYSNFLLHTLILFRDSQKLPAVKFFLPICPPEILVSGPGLNSYKIWQTCSTIYDVVSGLVIVYGALAIGMAYVASQLGEVLEAALSLQGMVGGPIVAVFTLAAFFPFANSYVSRPK